MNDFLMKALHKMRLLPLLIVVASLSFMVRIGDTVFQIRNLSGSAYAEEVKPEDKKEADKKEEIKPEEDKPAEDKKEEAQKEENKTDSSAKEAPKESDDNTKPEWADASDLDYSTMRKEVFEELVQRREKLEQREKEMAQKEALLKAAAVEMNKKVEELNAIRTDIQGLLKKQSAEESANIDKLVKIYEGMKPKDAARIFNALDMDVLLSVVTKMSERKSSAIISQMDAEKARGLTLVLSEQNKLPEGDNSPASDNMASDASNPPDAPLIPEQ